MPEGYLPLIGKPKTPQPSRNSRNHNRNDGAFARVKLYIASILGIGTRDGIPDTKHFPIILDAERIADTRKEACEAANRHCPPSQYPLRHVVIRPIPVAAVQTNLLPIALALVAVMDTAGATEPAIQFQCGNVERADPEEWPEIIFAELDEPPA